MNRDHHIGFLGKKKATRLLGGSVLAAMGGYFHLQQVQYQGLIVSNPSRFNLTLKPMSNSYTGLTIAGSPKGSRIENSKRTHQALC
jgi:hypothetical protein